MNFQVIDMGDEIDKTGFREIQRRAFVKAAQIRHLVHSVTIGPDAMDSPTPAINVKSSPEPSPGPQKNNKLKKKTVRTMKRNSREWLHDSLDDNSDCLERDSEQRESFIGKKILAELDRLSCREAQSVKFAYIKAWEERALETAAEVAKKKAREEAEALQAQQIKLREMAKLQELYRQKELVLAQEQAKRDLEATQKLEESKKQQQEAEMKHREQLKIRSENCDKIYTYQSQFASKYKEILDIVKNCKVQSKNLSNHFEKLKSINETFVSLAAKCKNYEITTTDVDFAADLLKTVKSSVDEAKDEIAKITAESKQEEETRKKDEKIEVERKQKTEEQKKDLVKDQNQYHIRVYEALRNNLNNVEQQLKQLSDNKKFTNDCQKAVNVPINSVSAQSSAHLNDKYKKLHRLLLGETVVVNDARFNASSHPLGTLFAMNFLAHKIVMLGEVVVSSHPEAAFSIAAVALALWTDFPEFGKLLMAHFHRACPLLIPYYWVRGDESEEEYYRKLGFKYSNGTREELDKYLKKQSGIVKLYSAIIVTTHKKSNQGKPHPLPISESWRWMSTFLASEPKADISATVLLDMLEGTGFHMMSNYGAQFRKLLHVICVNYLPLVEKVTVPGRGGAVTRLRAYLEELGSGKPISPPKGMLPANFW